MANKFRKGDVVRLEYIYDPGHVLTYSIGDVGIIVDISLNHWNYLVKFDSCESAEWIFETWLERENPIFRCE